MSKNDPHNLKELIKQGYLYPAWLPEKNDSLFNEEGKSLRQKLISETGSEFPEDISLLNFDNLKDLDGYMVFLTEKDYGALSPLMWNTLFERTDFNYRAIYFVGDSKDAATIMSGLKSDPKYVGGGFGSGWKEQYAYLDKVSPPGLKSVNFIAKDSERKLVGYNTDIEGLLLPLEERLEQIGNRGLQGKTVVMLGAGGVGKELPRHLVQRGVGKLIILNRTTKKAEELAREANKVREGVAEYGGEYQIKRYLSGSKVNAVINVTKKGAEPLQDYSAFAEVDLSNPEGVKENNEESLKIAKILLDKNPDILIYDITLPKNGNPKTLEIANEAGLENLIKGTGMVVNQGAIAVRRLSETNPERFGKLHEEQAKKIFGEVAL